jgi:hypothetical protein
MVGSAQFTHRQRTAILLLPALWVPETRYHAWPVAIAPYQT